MVEKAQQPPCQSEVILGSANLGPNSIARDNNIHVAISNPCIELWLLLHFRGNPGMQGLGTIVKSLKKYVPKYDKHVTYATYGPLGYAEAVDRARKMDQDAKESNEPYRNPTTGFYELTELIRS